MSELLFDEPTETPAEREKRWKEFDRRIQDREHDEMVAEEVRKDPLWWDKMEDSLEQKNRLRQEREGDDFTKRFYGKNWKGGK